MVPDTASGSAVSQILPHLRPKPGQLFHFPALSEQADGGGPPKATHLVLLRGEVASWPMPLQEYHQYLDSVVRSPHWEVIHDRDSLVILRRR